MAMTLAACTATEHKVEFVGVTERMLIHTARNVLADGFLKTDCPWAFWLDSDMVLPPSTINTMLRRAKELNAKFLTGVYYQRVGNHRPVIGIRDDRAGFKDDFSTVPVSPGIGAKTPFKVDVCGFGCVLTHRDVFAGMSSPYFMNGRTEQWVEYSEDYYFCREARRLGVDIWAIPELDCGHIGEAPLIFRKDCTTEVVEYDRTQFAK